MYVAASECALLLSKTDATGTGGNIRKSADSLCRDATDTPYSVIQMEAIILGCSATNKTVKLAKKHC